MIKVDNDKLNEFAEYLLEAFFSAVNVEESLPPGFSQSDMQDVEDYVDISEATEPLLGPDDTGVKPADMEPMLQKKKELGGKADHETPYIHRSTFTVVDDGGKEIDLDKLRQTITQRPERILTQNNKIEKSGGKTYAFFNLTLPAYRGLWYDEKANEWKIVTTCPSAGMCKQVCYARKGGYVQFPSAFTFSARILNFLLNDWQGFKNQLASEIEAEHQKFSQKGVVVVVRWHDSGDFFNEKYLQIALDIAKSTPEVIHYAYTKSVGMVDKASKPKNFVFNFSMGGTQDTSIKPEHKKSVIVPKQYFKDLFPQVGPHLKLEGPISPENLKVLQQRLSKAYSVPAKDIITYQQLIKTPYDPKNATPKWHVIVKPGDGDDAAMRKDVITTMLFIH